MVSSLSGGGSKMISVLTTWDLLRHTLLLETAQIIYRPGKEGSVY